MPLPTQFMAMPATTMMRRRCRLPGVLSKSEYLVCGRCFSSSMKEQISLNS